jgi:hypothetical protein
MRPKARGLVQHGGPPGWLEESDHRKYSREGWSLLTVETEVNEVSKSTYKSCPFLVGFLGLSRQESIVIIKCGIDDDCVKGRCSTQNFPKSGNFPRILNLKNVFPIGSTMVPCRNHSDMV